MQQKGASAITIVTGKLSKESATPVAENTLFEVASITKPFVSALILAKIQLGATTLDTTAKSILQGDLPAGLLKVKGVDKTDSITLRQLLTHTSGLLDYWATGPTKSIEAWYSELSLTAPTTHPRWADFKTKTPNRMAFQGIVRPFLESSNNNTALKTRVWTPAEVLAIAATLDSGPPGEFFYSDTGYMVLGLVAEKLWGTTLESAITDNLMKPLGVTPTDTWFRYNSKAGTDNAITKNKLSILSHRYSTNDLLPGAFDMTLSAGSALPGSAVLTNYYYSADWAGGGLVSTAADLGNFWMALMNSEEEPWKTVASEMRSSVKLGTAYGYGVYAEGGDFFSPVRLLGHAGDGGCSMFYEKADKIVITGTDNSGTLNEFIKTNLKSIKACAAAQPGGTALSASARVQPVYSAVTMWMAAGISVFFSVYQRRLAC
jgi:D-alanyl-D-alanine carboxypeptidase